MDSDYLLIFVKVLACLPIILFIFIIIAGFNGWRKERREVSKIQTTIDKLKVDKLGCLAVVEIWLEFISQTNWFNLCLDEELLPLPKETIRNSLIALLDGTEMTEGQQILQDALLLLERFHTPIATVVPRSSDELSVDEMNETVKRLSLIRQREEDEFAKRVKFLINLFQNEATKKDMKKASKVFLDSSAIQIADNLSRSPAPLQQ